MTINPLDIIEEQLVLLAKQSKKGTLTYEEAQTLERIAKLQILLRMKSLKRTDEDECAELSTEDLKALLPLLKNDDNE